MLRTIAGFNVNLLTVFSVPHTFGNKERQCDVFVDFMSILNVISCWPRPLAGGFLCLNNKTTHV